MPHPDLLHKITGTPIIKDHAIKDYAIKDYAIKDQGKRKTPRKM